MEPETYLYRRIETALRQLIQGEKLQVGDRLPSEVDLARQFQTTRVTVARALRQLAQEGLVQRLVGRGTFVASRSTLVSVIDTRTCYSFEEQMGLTDKTVTYRLIGFVRVPIPTFAQSHLHLPDDDTVYQLDRLRIVDERTVGLERRYLPPALATHVSAPMLTERSIIDILREILGYRVPRLAVTLYPDVADAQIAKLLGLLPGSPISVREHVYYDRDGTTILCGRNVFSGDVRLRYVLGDGLER